MGVSTDGQICYGVAFDEGEGSEFPWRNDGEDIDINEWWHDQHGWKESDDNPAGAFYPYTAEGGYKSCLKLKRDDERIGKWYEAKQKWIAENVPPLPVQEVNYCSSECPMYVLAIPSSFRNNNRGYAEKFNPAELIVTQEEVNNFLEFCEKYEIELPCQPAWLLTSYWG